MADVKEKAEEKNSAKPEAAGAPVPDVLAGSPDGVAKPVRPQRVRAGRVVPFGIVHIRATFNNTIISVSDSKGGVIAWSTSGRAGFKGSRKSTAFAASVVAQEVARQAVARGMQEVEVRVQGPGAGRESAIRALQSAGLNLTMIKDVTPMPHNGCRPRKRRRV